MRAAALACLVLLCAACAPRAPVVEAATADPARGRLLYETACIACHTTQAHWRERSIVKGWPDLVGQVGRWQQVAGQGWSAAEIHDVAAYLNGRFYRVPCPQRGCTGMPPG
jgi:mono/diheme cytochrome c family protein